MSYHVRATTEPPLWAQPVGGGLVAWSDVPGLPLPKPAAADLARRASVLLGRSHELVEVRE